MKNTPKNKNLIYDVGMHHGQDTDFYLKKGFQVIGFEANPDNAEVCRKRFADAISAGNLIIVEGAIAENNAGESVKFYRNQNHSLWGSSCDDWAYRNEVMGTENEIIEVKPVNFAAEVEKYGVPFYLKADIVGSEMICLRGLLGFENKPDYISIRSEKVVFRRLEEEFKLLEDLGYDRFKAVLQSFMELKVPITLPSGEKINYSFEEGASGTFGEDSRGEWKTKEEALKDYQRVFVYYWLFGDYSYLVQTEKGRKFIAQMERIVRRPLPGWYDTHAKHSAVE